MVPTLIRAWANPASGFTTKERPERIALGRIVGEERVGETLLRTMRESNPGTQANLRARCWELLMKSGDVGRLRALLADESSWRGDGMLTDLARVATELGPMPTTREEILWARKLCEPERAAFFGAARAARVGRDPVASDRGRCEAPPARASDRRRGCPLRRDRDADRGPPSRLA
jgi:hypothetical protein